MDIPADLQERLAAIIGRQVYEGADVDERDQFDRIQRACRLIGAAVERADDALAVPGAVDSLRSYLDAIDTELQGYGETGDEGQLDQAEASRVALLNAATPWLPLSGVPSTGSDVASQGATYRLSMGQLLRRLTDDVDQVTTDVADLGESIAAAAREVETNSSAGTAALAALEARLGELSAEAEAAVTAIRTEFDTSRTAWGTEISDAVSAVIDDGGEAVDEFGKQRDAWLQDAQTAFKKLRDTLTAEGQAEVATMKRLREEVSKQHKILSDTLLSGHFGDEAKRQAKRATFWSVVAVVIFGVAVLVGFAFAAGWIDTPTDAEHLVLKAAVTLSIAGIGGYAVQQARGHRAREAEAKKIQIELASLDTFLEHVAPGHAEAIRELVGLRIFTGRKDGGSSEDVLRMLRDIRSVSQAGEDPSVDPTT